ncbi:MAG TPA: cytidine deaminase [Phenylobacterium sp.]|jgi:cytidine deaminase|nr:cytidine deaminase [Phenylobacterium sp.]
MTDVSEIAARLRALLPRAHAPYSAVQVACAVEGADRTTHVGVNVENAAYPQGLCAEASAIAAAVTEGATALTRIYVASSLPGLVWPCGGCRQKIFEFAARGCEVVAIGPAGETGRQTIEQLLPLVFRLDPAQVRRG